MKAFQPVDRCREPGQGFDVVNDEKQRSLNQVVGDVRLGEAAVIHLTGENRCRKDQIGDEIAGVNAGALQHPQQHFPDNQQIEVFNDGGQATRHLLGFLLLTGVEGNRLCVVTHPYEAIAVIRFKTQLEIVQPHQLAASHNHQDRHPGCIGQKGKGEPLTHRIKDEDIEGKGEDRIKNIQRKTKGLCREITHILGNTLIGVINIGGRFIIGIEHVIGPIPQVIVHQAQRQPFAPEQPKFLGEIKLQAANWQCHSKTGAVDPEVAIRRIAIPGDQRIGQIPGEECDAGVDAVHAQQHQDDQAEKQPRQPAAMPELAPHGGKHHSPQHEQGTDARPPSTGPEHGQGRLDATEVLAGQLRKQPRQAVHQAGDQEQHDPGHTEEQAHQQSKELPAVVFGVGEEVGLRKPTQLGGLIAQVLKLVGHATAELCSVWLSPRRFAADLNREATPEDVHRSHAHGGETPSGQHRRHC